MTANNEEKSCWEPTDEELAQMAKLDKTIPESFDKYVTFVKTGNKISYEIDRHRMFVDVYEARCKVSKEGIAAIESIDVATVTNSLLLR